VVIIISWTRDMRFSRRWRYTSW